ncbi:Protein cms1 [Malassezia yamatoensis]|uniref:Protein cms1 n=1 Tax=Malassezia yamatoensis TaxID=253288 RepID=A0AAJ5YUL0_9BASI|nr:Protein cms1 [Malassezia yamatoensis]
MADALDDGLILDDTLVSYSDEDDEQNKKEQTPSTSPIKSGKTSDAMDAKKQKRKAARQKVRRKILTQKAAAYREEVHAGQAVALQPYERQADFVAAQQRKTFPKLSSLELQEIAVPFALPKEDDLSSARSDAPWNKKNGTPRVLMVAGNAQRAADLARELRRLLETPEHPPAKRRKGAESSTSGGVAKLFARHFKVTEQISHLQDNAAPLAVGTPHRIAQLIDAGALRTDQLAALVIDHTWTDAKLRTIFDTPETRQALVHLLCNGKLREAYQRDEPRCRVIFY